LRDYSDLNAKAGTELIAAKGFSEIATFEKGDAFDRNSLANMRPRPTIGIVSGLYELFSDNSLVRSSLQGLGAAIPQGGFLVYTNQPWHPQLEFITASSIHKVTEAMKSVLISAHWPPEADGFRIISETGAELFRWPK
jgi:hypothetical protein